MKRGVSFCLGVATVQCALDWRQMPLMENALTAKGGREL